MSIRDSLITILKSPFTSGTNTPVSRSRANSIDLDSSFDMIGDEERAAIIAERARVLQELLEVSGFMGGGSRRKHVRRTTVTPFLSS